MALTPRQHAVLDKCSSPHTVNSLAAEFNVGYHTARREVISLIELSLLRELPFRDGFAKQYQTVFKLDDGKTIESLQFYDAYQAKAINALSLIKQQPGKREIVGVASDIISMALAGPLWDHHVDHDDLDNLEVKMFPPAEMIKEKLPSAIDALRAMADLGEQILNAPIWDNEDYVKLLYGNEEVNWEHVKMYATKLHNLAIERDWK